MTTPYDAKQMLLLAYSSAAGDTQPYKDCRTVSQSLLPDIDKQLTAVNTQFNTNWEIVWGPATYSFPINYDGRHFDNVVYVARDGQTSNYVIAIAGTDPVSIADWVFEDLLVVPTVPWLWSTSYTPRPRISLATYNGLSILLNISPCLGLAGRGENLLSFLSTITTEAINIYTTGHSLGGALAPTLTLALENLSAMWDPQKNATFYPFAFAGPTPGDAAFAAYFEQTFPKKLHRVWNRYDVVPHAWDTTHMKELPTLYGKEILDVKLLIDKVLPAIEPIGYTPLNNEPWTFEGTIQNRP